MNKLNILTKSPRGISKIMALVHTNNLKTFFQKPIDFPGIICYNIYSEGDDTK